MPYNPQEYAEKKKRQIARAKEIKESRAAAAAAGGAGGGGRSGSGGAAVAVARKDVDLAQHVSRGGPIAQASGKSVERYGLDGDGRGHINAYVEYKRIVGDADGGTPFTDAEYAAFKQRKYPNGVPTYGRRAGAGSGPVGGAAAPPKKMTEEETMELYEQRYQARRKAERAGGIDGNRGYAIGLNMPPLALMDDVLFDSLNLDSNGDPLRARSARSARSATRRTGTSSPALPSSPSMWHVRVIKGYAAENSKELTVDAGDVVEVLDNSKQWWNVRNVSTGKNGFVPSNFLQTRDGQEAREALPTRKKGPQEAGSSRGPSRKAPPHTGRGDGSGGGGKRGSRF